MLPESQRHPFVSTPDGGPCSSCGNKESHPVHDLSLAQCVEKEEKKTRTPKTWVVRVVQLEEYATPLDRTLANPLNESWIECLRYAGLIDVVDTGSGNMCFDILPPAHIPAGATRAWADNNASRIRSFGMNAAAAPRAK